MLHANLHAKLQAGKPRKSDEATQTILAAVHRDMCALFGMACDNLKSSSTAQVLIKAACSRHYVCKSLNAVTRKDRPGLACKFCKVMEVEDGVEGAASEKGPEMSTHMHILYDAIDKTYSDRMAIASEVQVPRPSSTGGSGRHLRMDLWILTLDGQVVDLFVEVDGEQHFESGEQGSMQRGRDEQKDDEILHMHRRLLRVHYLDVTCTTGMQKLAAAINACIANPRASFIMYTKHYNRQDRQE